MISIQKAGEDLVPSCTVGEENSQNKYWEAFI